MLVEPMDEILKCDHVSYLFIYLFIYLWTIFNRASTEQWCYKVIMLYKMFLIFELVDEILTGVTIQMEASVCEVLSCGADYFAVQSGSNF